MNLKKFFDRTWHRLMHRLMHRVMHRVMHCLLTRKKLRRTINASAHMPGCDAWHDALNDDAASAASAAAHEKILVVFSDDTDLWWLKWLKRGFRHCFVVMRLGEQWVAIDPMAHHLQITVPQLPTDFDLKNWFSSQGLCVIESQPAPALLRCYPPIFLSCVELVKRILGLRNPFIVTPAQLYNYLNEYNRSPSWDH